MEVFVSGSELCINSQMTECVHENDTASQQQTLCDQNEHQQMQNVAHEDELLANRDGTASPQPGAVSNDSNLQNKSAQSHPNNHLENPGFSETMKYISTSPSLERGESLHEHSSQEKHHLPSPTDGVGEEESLEEDETAISLRMPSSSSVDHIRAQDEQCSPSVRQNDIHFSVERQISSPSNEHNNYEGNTYSAENSKRTDVDLVYHRYDAVQNKPINSESIHSNISSHCAPSSASPSAYSTNESPPHPNSNCRSPLAYNQMQESISSTFDSRKTPETQIYCQGDAQSNYNKYSSPHSFNQANNSPPHYNMQNASPEQFSHADAHTIASLHRNLNIQLQNTHKTTTESRTMTEHINDIHQDSISDLGMPSLSHTQRSMASMLAKQNQISSVNSYSDGNIRSPNSINLNGLPMHEAASHLHESSHSSSSDLQSTHSRPNSVYDFDPSAGNSERSMVGIENAMIMSHSHHEDRYENQMHSSGKENYQMNPLGRCGNMPPPKPDDILSNLNSINHMHQEPGTNSMGTSLSSISGNNSLSQSFSNSMSMSSGDFPNTASSYDPLLMRRGRGRPRGSKNGSGIGRGRGSYGRGTYRFSSDDEDRTCTAYDLRHISDPFGTARRGRPRSRFIVDLGEQNHEAWTKARINLNVSDAELTTLLLSLLESRREIEDSAETDTILSLVNTEYCKWKEKFNSQVSMLSHYASIHNTNCCTCLGINLVSRKKKLPTLGTGKRGRPRKYPPPVGYGPGMQRPDTIDEDGNIFEPQCILKDGTIVKSEPHDEKPKIHGLDVMPDASNSSSSNGPITSPISSLPPRAMLTHEELQKRREYYSNHKNKIKYVCHYCQVHFYHKPNFDYHISKLEREGKCRIYDKVNNLYLCEACGEGFSWREKLEKHLRLAEQHGTHNQKELLIYGDFQCNMCGKTFNKRNTYLQHIKWHEDREDVPCVICANMFKQTELRRHLMDVHNNDSLPCCYCGKLFTSRKYLDKHEMVHQTGNFPCPECGKCFSQKLTMQHHLRSHSLDKEYSCDACGNMYTPRLGLCHHLRKQFGSAEFGHECEVCTTYFCSVQDMQLHKRKVHNMAPEQMNEELPPESYLPFNMRSHQMSPDDRDKVYSETNSVVKNMLSGSLGKNIDSDVNIKPEGSEPMDESQIPIIGADQIRINALRGQTRENYIDDGMRGNMREAIMRENSMPSEMRENNMRDDSLHNLSLREEQMRANLSLQENELSMRGGNPIRDALIRDETMRNGALRGDAGQDEVMRDETVRDEGIMGEDQLRGSIMRDSLLRDNPLRDLAMRNTDHVMREEHVMRENPIRDNALFMNEHMRHMVERRDLGSEEQQLRLNPMLHEMQQQHQQPVDEQLHMPQDLTRMGGAHLSDAERAANNSSGSSNNMLSQQHMSDLRQQGSPARLSDTPSHMTSDQLGRMAMENFNRMTSTPGGYLAEHIRRMAESRNVSDGGHYEDRDYNSRIDDLRTRALGDNLSHMGVIRPSQTPACTPQWPPHMQNHSLEGMNQTTQGSQHTLYPLPFWPYDPSLRHYNH